jgi:hypothetical protein
MIDPRIDSDPTVVLSRSLRIAVCYHAYTVEILAEPMCVLRALQGYELELPQLVAAVQQYSTSRK